MKRLAVFVLLAVGCGSTQVQDPALGPSAKAPDWRRGVVPVELADYVVVVGEGDSEIAARVQAEQALERRIWGEGPLPQGPTVPDSDLLQKTDATGTHAVLLAASKSVLARLMQARIDATGYRADEPQAPYGARLGIAIANMEKARDRQRACAWVSTCTTDEGSAMRAALEQHLQLLELAPKPAEVPFRRGVGPLQQLTVMCHMKGRPAEPAHGIMMRAFDRGVALGGPVKTASDGAVRFDLTGITGTSVRVTLEAPGLGDIALPQVEVGLRDISFASARVALQLDLTNDDKRASGDPAIKALTQALAGQGVAKAQALPPRFAGLLASPRQTELALRDIADLADGSIDVIVLGQIQTAFANRMGARSVWHEAKGSIAVYDVWTATLIAEHSRETQQVGLGDAAAQSKAISELAKLLAADVKNDIAAR